jgi:peptidoglycan-associated lipoprotein
MKNLLVTACTMALLTACSCGHTIGKGGNVVTPTASENMIYERELVKLGDRVFFTVDSSALSLESKIALKKQADFIKENKTSLQYTIEGHCDERGTTEYNLALGERRANSAKKFLVSHGIQGSKITIVSYGKERPIALGHKESAWKQNRRSVTVVN